MTIEAAVRAIEAEFEVAMGRPERVLDAVETIRRERGSEPPPSEVVRLLPLLERRTGRIAHALYPLIEEAAEAADAPWTWIRGMIRARDEALRLRSLDLAARLLDSGRLEVDDGAILDLASQFLPADGTAPDPEAMSRISRIARRYRPAAPRPGLAPLVDLYLHGSAMASRRLAAVLLDGESGGVPPARAERLIGREALRFLAPYMAYTQASHGDLLDLAPAGRIAGGLLDSLQRAEAVCGERLLRDAIVRIGWTGMNLSLEVRSLLEIRRDGSLPFFLPAGDGVDAGAEWTRPPAERRFRFVAHGGRATAPARQTAGDDAVSRFRSYNLAHAEALAEILSLTALTRERVARTCDLMDRIVGDFVRLFAGFDEECARLPELYAGLRRAIDALLGEQEEGGPFSVDLTRLVQMFEEPRHLGEVTTLHGLKRYLHQRGLRLGFRLVEGGRSTNRTVDLLVAGEDRILAHARRIQYVDFEPAEEDRLALPYAVRIAAEGLLHAMLYGAASAPDVKVFCYGNEVHYYISYGSHPAFLRIDFAPPLMGGMCDLEYYGVSKNELEAHPAPDLPAIRQFFRKMEFDCKVARTRIHARYDKERARDLADLCRHAESLFRLLPHLMDLDWIIGSLRLDESARRLATDAWADRFLVWGVVPAGALLSADRLGIVERIDADPGGDREVVWDGAAPYRDRFPDPPPPGRAPWATGSRPDRPAPAASAAGGEAVRFASILAQVGAALESAIRVARLILPLERSLRFRTTGSVQGYEVQSAEVALLGATAACSVLRDGAGMIRLALFAMDGAGSGERGTCVASEADPAQVASILRSLRYLTAGSDPVVAPGEAEDLRRLFRERSSHEAARVIPGERAIAGVRASPGRAAGIVRLGAAGRAPEELDGAILVAPVLRPEDNTHLYHAAGIVTTGGGILSHAGLLALQFRKPAMMIPARWDAAAPSPGELIYDAVEYDEESILVGEFHVTVRRSFREREERLRDGDLAVLDVEEGVLRILGQEPDALALQEGLSGLAEASRRLAAEPEADRVLALRGGRLRLLHQLERIFARLRDPVLIRHAVHEILFAEGATEGLRGEKERLLSMLLRDPERGLLARRMIDDARDALERIARARESEAAAGIPAAQSLHETLSLRLEALRLRSRLAEIGPARHPAGSPDLDGLARRRLEELRRRDRAGVRLDPHGDPALRHRLRRIERVDHLIGPREESDPLLEQARDSLRREDLRRLRAAEGARVLRASDGGEEIRSLIGSKAANLAEIERILGPGAVPSWFVVSDAAFREVLSRRARPGGLSLAAEIDAVLRGGEEKDQRKAARIRALWEDVEVPASVAEAIVQAYRGIPRDAGADEREIAGAPAGGAPVGEESPYVAVRSSGREEDTEAASRAGEFETFLFIRGESDLLAAVRRAWAGLWTARAIHNRTLFGIDEEGVGGGILIQQICWSRVSGVLQTIHVAERRADEILVNAGLGMGEGIVSGMVGADWIAVEKTGDLVRGPLRFRYVTADKKEKVIFDARAGGGTIRVETLYHERFRAALEYAEILELVRSATVLEQAFGIPLDIEFGYEGSSLRLLQVRPIGAFAACVEETALRFPLGPPAGGARGREAEMRRRGGEA